MGRVLLVLALLGALALAAGAYVAWQWYETPQTKLAGAATLIEPGEPYASVLSRWHQAGLIDEPQWWRIAGRLSGLATKMQAGEYRLTEAGSPRAVLEQLSRGQGTLSYQIQFLEGWTLKEIRVALAQAPHLQQTLTDVTDAELLPLLREEMNEELPEGLVAVDDSSGAIANAEGWFFPDTYSYQRDTRDVDILGRAFARMVDELNEVWAARGADLPLESAYDALILASIVEKETGQSADREFISQVFIRRLDQGMKLQTDPTVIYGVGEQFAGDLTRKHLRTDTPYNSYTRYGLPPTPIAAPGKESLLAAVAPAPTDYLFFVARGDGSTEFSRTLEEHNAAVRRFQLGR